MTDASELAKSEIPFASDFGDPKAEYDAFATGAVVAECWRSRTLLKLTGDDRHQWLHNVCTNEIKALQPGSGCEVFLTDARARVIGHGFVFATGDALWVESVSGEEDRLFEHFDRYIITEDVEIHRLSNSHSQLLLSGPLVTERLSAVCHESIDSLPPMGNGTLTLDGVDVGIRRPGITSPSSAGEQPWLVLNCLTNQYDSLWNTLTAAGANRFIPVGTSAYEARRIEAIFPVYGIDITSDQMAPEVGRNTEAISYTKGCYLGQEPIARLDAMGHTNRELRGIRFDSDPGLKAGDALKSDSGGNVGIVTSIASRPGTDAVVALGYVKRSHMKSGSTVCSAGNIQGTVFTSSRSQ
jgi:folate-binding protein YgfZ